MGIFHKAFARFVEETGTRAPRARAGEAEGNELVKSLCKGVSGEVAECMNTKLACMLLASIGISAVQNTANSKGGPSSSLSAIFGCNIDLVLSVSL